MKPRQVVGLVTGVVAIEAGFMSISTPITDPVHLAFMATTMLFPGVLSYEMAGWYLRRRWAALVGVIASPSILVGSDVMSAQKVFLTPPNGYVGVDYTALLPVVMGYLLIAGVPVAAYILVDVLADALKGAGDSDAV